MSIATTPGLVKAEACLCTAIEAMRNERKATPTDHDGRELALAITEAEHALMRLRRAVLQGSADTMPTFR